MKDILILTGSKSDYSLTKDLEQLLAAKNISYDLSAISCHRDLKELPIFLDDIRDEYRIIIAIANSVANMPAIVAGHLKNSKIIVIGAGLDNKGMRGIDSLLSINTIPKGVPLLNTGVGTVGLWNAGLSAIKIIGALNEKI